MGDNRQFSSTNDLMYPRANKPRSPVFMRRGDRAEFKTTQQRLRENSLTTLGGDNSMIELQRNNRSPLDDSQLDHPYKLQRSDFEGLAPEAILPYTLTKQ